MLYAIKIVLTTIRSRIVKLNLLYDLRFDYAFDPNEFYSLKIGYPSSHQFALDKLSGGMSVLDLGSGPGYVAEELDNRGIDVISVDQKITELTKKHSLATLEGDIESFDLSQVSKTIDAIFLLDIIEHLSDPEAFLLRLREYFGDHEHWKFPYHL